MHPDCQRFNRLRQLEIITEQETKVHTLKKIIIDFCKDNKWDLVKMMTEILKEEESKLKLLCA